MDCMYRSHGCVASYTDKYFNYLRDYGTPLEADYTYKASQGQCPNTRSLFQQPTPIKKYQIGSYIDFNKVNDAFLTMQVQKAPVLAFFLLTDQVRFYQSGILNPTDCRHDQQRSIGVVIDGYSMDSRNNGYYIVKMPFGTGYGQQGNLHYVKTAQASWIEGVCSFYELMVAVQSKTV